MPEKALDVYQGHDWLTHRWPVAQMYDTLDRIRAVCQSAAALGAAGLQSDASSGPCYEMHVSRDCDRHDLLLCMVELCDDLSAEIDAVQADLFLPHHKQKDAACRWLGFEMHLHLTEMRRVALVEHQALGASGHATDEILALGARIRDLLSSIDR